MFAGYSKGMVVNMSHILLLEDDESLIDGLVYSLKKNEFNVSVVKSVKEAKNYLDSHSDIELMLLDVTLPDGTGFQVCEYAREKENQVPIIFLTAADEEYNIIRGLDSGGDDYITKPFKLGELCSRIKALLRRANLTHSAGTQDLTLKSGPVEIDLMGSRVMLNKNVIELTAVEYRLLCILIRNKNRVVTRQIIFDSMWDGNGDFVDDNTLSVYIRRLREKIEEDPSHPVHLKTARGFGYIWEEK